MKICSICKEDKSLELFYKYSNSKDGRQRYCIDCKKKKYREDYSDLHRRANIIKTACAKRSRQNNFEFDLTTEWIKRGIKEGCELTGTIFNMEDTKSPFSPSVDRIDSNKGYTQENCRVIVLIANLAKNNWNDEALYILAERLLEFKSN